MPEDINRKMKEGILKSGFPLESQILRIMNKYASFLRPNQRYTCGDDVKEIDLHCHFLYQSSVENPKNDKIPQWTYFDILIECKKSQDKPWVFFSTDVLDYDFTPSKLVYVSTIDKIYDMEFEPDLLYRIRGGLDGFHYLDRSIPRCVSYTVPFKKEKGGLDIYRAVQSVEKYLEYEYKYDMSFQNELEDPSCVTHVYIPLIVLDGVLFEAKPQDDDDVEFIPRDHVLLRHATENRVILIDVVRKEYLEQFMNRLKNDLKVVAHAINELDYPEDFINLCWLGEP